MSSVSSQEKQSIINGLEEVNELDLLSKQSEVKHIRETADKIAATDLSSISVQQHTASEQQGFTCAPA